MNLKSFIRRKSVRITGFLLLIIILGAGIFALVRYNINYFEKDNLEFTSDVFEKGEGGYFCFRIPGILVLPGGRIIAFAEGRVNSISDYGDIDLVMKYSDDGGWTWSDLITIWDAGEISLSNPCPVYDPEIDTIFLHIVKDRRQCYVLNSTDGGITWSMPEPINFGKDEWYFAGPAPGHGIRLSTGRLLIPGMYNLMKDGKESGVWGSFYYYSDDHGRTWRLGHDFGTGTNEFMAAQMGNGGILALMRPNRDNVNGSDFIMGSYSEDGGITSSEPQPIGTFPTTVCEVSVITYSDEEDREFVIAGHPLNPDSRTEFGLRISNDGGKTWNKSVMIYKGPSAYSDLAVYNGTIVGLFERGQIMYQEKIGFFKTRISSVHTG